MFRRLRYRKWLVAGIGLAALAFPAAALAGNHNMSSQAYKALVAKSEAMNARYSPQNAEAQAYRALVAKSEAMNARYAGLTYSAPDGWYPHAVSLTQQSRQGVVLDGRNPDTVDAAQAAQVERSLPDGWYSYAVPSTKQPPTLVDGRSPDTIDFAAQAHSPVVTIERDPGFQWGDFGIGLLAAMGVLLVLGLSRRSSGRGSRPATSS